MAHKIGTAMIATFATLAVASLIVFGASVAMAGQGAMDMPTAGNGDCDRTMDKLQTQNCTCDGTGVQSGAQKTAQDRICAQLMIKEMSQNRLMDGSCDLQNMTHDRICAQLVTSQMTQDRLMDGSCLIV